MFYLYLFIGLLQLYDVSCGARRPYEQVSRIQKRDEQVTSLNDAVIKAESQIKNYYMDKVWDEVNKALSKSSHDLLKLYSESTVIQTQQVIEYILNYSNLTQVEANKLRKQSQNNNTKDYNKLECINMNERSLIRAFKQTGYNLHNCIRNAQIHSENITTSITQELEQVKMGAYKSAKFFLSELSNCLDEACVFRILMNGLRGYDELEVQLKGKVTELSIATTRYLMNHIALGCVSSSMKQIYENYEIGKGLMVGCVSNNTAVVQTN